MLRSLFATLFALLFASVTAGAVNAAPVLFDAELEEHLRTADPDSDVAVIIRFAGRPDLLALKDGVPAKTREKLIRGLRQKLGRSEQALRDFLQGTRARAIKSLWLINGVGVTLPARLVRSLSRLDGVERISLDAALAPLSPPRGGGNLLSVPDSEHTSACDAGDCSILSHQPPVLLNSIAARDRSPSSNTQSFPVYRQLSTRAPLRAVGARGPPLNAYPAVPGMAPAAREAAS